MSFLRLIRLKPFNPRKGYVTRRYFDSPNGVLFREDRGWYRCTDAAFAAKLEGLRQKENDEDSPPMFDVCTEEDAKRLDRGESIVGGRAAPDQALDMPRRRGAAAGAITTGDAVARRKPVVDEEESEAEPEMIDPDPLGKELEADRAEAARSQVGRVTELGRADGSGKLDGSKRKRGGASAPAKRNRSTRAGDE